MIELETQQKMCRLCLESDNGDLIDMFAYDNQRNDESSLLQHLFELFQITYTKSNILPNTICQLCLKMVNNFAMFRENVLKCESDLQKWAERPKVAADLNDIRPGLNGNAGVFVPEDDCIIIKIDPDQDYETSEDDFSMESETDTENASTTTTKTTADVAYQHQTTTPDGISNLQSIGIAPSTDQMGLLKPMFQPKTFPDIANTDNAPKNSYLCQYCDMAFTQTTDCYEHELTRHDASNPFACNFCQFRCTMRQNLIQHIKEIHDPDRPYVCAICVKGFCRRSDLKKHTIVHTGVRPFTCPICTKSFSRNTNLTKHMHIHSSVKPHVCQHCPRSFTTNGELIRHSRSHTESKPFKCTHCSATFTRRDKLNVHEQAHLRHLKSSPVATNSIGNFSVGGAGLINVPNLYGEHETSYNNNAAKSDDPYRHSILAAQLQQRPAVPKISVTKQHACNICAKTFTRERDLQSHQALHLDGLFTCKQCGIGFSRREKLLRHEQEQHGPQFACTVCGMTFLKQDALDVHSKKHNLQPNVNSESPSGIAMSFFSKLVPNLGFYSETRPDERNDI